jgi:hypothetical protein
MNAKNYWYEKVGKWEILSSASFYKAGEHLEGFEEGIG